MWGRFTRILIAIGLSVSVAPYAVSDQRECVGEKVSEQLKTVEMHLGDLTPHEVTTIQQVTDSINWPIVILGSAARGERRFPGTDRPIGKSADGRSDIDYLAPMVSNNIRSEQMTSTVAHLAAMTSLPDIDPQPWHGILRGIPGIMIDRIWFFPKSKPIFVPAGEPNPKWDPDSFRN